MVEGAAKGLSFLHSEGMVHNDLKSANLLVDRTLHVKVCDFGLARIKSFGRSSLTAEVGTPVCAPSCATPPV